jgi:hypothetical protein
VTDALCGSVPMITRRTQPQPDTARAEQEDNK